MTTEGDLHDQVQQILMIVLRRLIRLSILDADLGARLLADLEIGESEAMQFVADVLRELRDPGPAVDTSRG